MQWLRFFLVFIGVASLLLRQKKLGKEKGQSPSEGVGGLGRTFMAVKIFYFCPQMLKNRGISGILANRPENLYLCRKKENGTD